MVSVNNYTGSFPFLHIAKEFEYPYQFVLLVAEQLAKHGWEPLTTGLEYAIFTATVKEEARRERVVAEGRAGPETPKTGPEAPKAGPS